MAARTVSCHVLRAGSQRHPKLRAVKLLEGKRKPRALLLHSAAMLKLSGTQVVLRNTLIQQALQSKLMY